MLNVILCHNWHTVIHTHTHTHTYVTHFMWAMVVTEPFSFSSFSQSSSSVLSRVLSFLRDLKILSLVLIVGHFYFGLLWTCLCCSMLISSNNEFCYNLAANCRCKGRYWKILQNFLCVRSYIVCAEREQIGGDHLRVNEVTAAAGNNKVIGCLHPWRC